MRYKRTLFILIVFGFLLGPSSAHSAGEDETPIAAEAQSNYVGSATCARCHANTYTSLQETWHQQILRSAEDANILGDFNSQDPDLTFKPEEVSWVLGGQYKQRYLTEIDGALFVLPAEWNVAAEEWVAYEVDSWQSRPYARFCAGCHTTGYDAETQTWIEPGVGCETCHGPGADHVASTGDRNKIVNPAELQFQDQVSVCAQCHSRGEDPSGKFPFPVGYRPGGPAEFHETFIFSTDENNFWPDGTAKRHHMQYQDWRQSVHRDSVGCIFCHTSHSKGETDHQTRMVDNDRCVICHEGNRDLANHIPFMTSMLETVNCTDCHMPQVSILLLTDFQIQSHTFRPPDPALSIAYGGQEQMPNACNLCHTEEEPEWALAVLNRQIPNADATRVPVPTAIAIPTQINAMINSSINETPANLPSIEPQQDSLLPWIIGLLLLAGLPVSVWIVRKVRQA